MYTIKQASIRTGLSVELLRAWERRYGVPTPARTGSGYRLYDDSALALVRRMKALVDSGWSPSQAAGAVSSDAATTEEAAPPEVAVGVPAFGNTTPAAPEPTAGVGAANGDPLAALRRDFLRAASLLDEPAMEAILGQALLALGPDETLVRFILPTMAAVGVGWANGEVSVGAEHAASGVVMRRLAALYEAASTPSGSIDCVIGLPPGGRHEIGALSFAVACKRAGLGVRYLGADVPIESWISAADACPGAILSIGAVSEPEADAAATVLAAVDAARPDTRIAIGGAGKFQATDGRQDSILLPDDVRKAVGLLRELRDNATSRRS